MDEPDQGGAYLQPDGGPGGRPGAESAGDPTIETPVVTAAAAPPASARRLLTRRVAPVLAVLVAAGVIAAVVASEGPSKRPVGVGPATTLATTAPTFAAGTAPSASTTTAPVKVTVRPSGSAAGSTETTLTPGVVVPSGSTGTSPSTRLPAFDAPTDLVAYAEDGNANTDASANPDTNAANTKARPAGATTDTAQVTWTAPASTGGAPVTTYRITTTPATTTVVAGGTSDEAQLAGLDPDTAYSVSVVATNAEDAVSPAAVTQLVNGAGAGQSTLWNTFHGDLMRSGQSSGPGPTSAKESWSWSAPAGETIAGDPLVGPGDDVYVALTGPSAMVQVLTPAGQPAWSWADPGHTATGVAVSSDGGAYAVTDDGIVSISPTGQTEWTAAEPGDGCTYISPLAVESDGTIFANSTCGTVTEITPAGDTGPTFGTAASGGSTVSFSADGGTAYAGSSTSTVYAWSVGGATPAKSWTSAGPAGVAPTQAPAVGPDGSVYLSMAAPSGGPGYVVALAASGAKRWTFTTAAPVEATPAVTATGLVVVGDLAGDLYAIDAATGQLVWSHSGGAGSYSSSAPAVAADGTIYIQGLSALQAVSNGGQVVWSAPVASNGASSPALSPDGTLYAVTADAGELVAF